MRVQANDNIDFVVIQHFDYELLNAASQLHIKHLSYRSFITMFGSKFMLELYRDILAERLGFFVFALDGKSVGGFVLGCTNSQQLFGLVMRRPFRYFKMIVPRLIVKPALIPKLFETLFYVKRENSAVDSELVVIVTDENYRDSGVGTRLVSVLNDEFRKRKIHQYKVTVHDEMMRSNNFYVKNGMRLSASFRMYGVKWNLYLNEIGR